MDNTALIKADLKPLFAKARAEGLWFYTSYQDLWFSPDELESHNSRGSFLWGAVNWRLRNPSERLSELDKQVKGSKEQRRLFQQRLAKS